MRVVFLDFDGVLHPAGGPPGTSLPFEWNHVLAALLEPFADVRIVIHSSWREHFSAPELIDFLEPVASRLVGAVDAGPKPAAIKRFLYEHPDVADALVLDDQVDEYASGFPVTVLECDPRTGISSKEVQRRLRDWLLGLPSQGGADR
ncbi:MAG: hypothetical protein JSS14_29075 [Proteobacteria bacterium]|nr:hypothetical protein [Pseudomonadota bacterium]